MNSKPTISSTGSYLWGSILWAFPSNSIQLVYQAIVCFYMESAFPSLEIIDIEITLEVPTGEVPLC